MGSTIKCYFAQVSNFTDDEFESFIRFMWYCIVFINFIAQLLSLVLWT